MPFAAERLEKTSSAARDLTNSAFFDILHQMSKKTIALKILKQYLLITGGCIIFSVGVALFLDANKIASGGVSGLAIILSHVLKDLNLTLLDSTAMWIIVLNVPLFILGAVAFGKNFVVASLYSTLVSSLLIELLNFIFGDLLSLLPLTDDIVIAGVIGGGLMGLGMGIIFKLGSTTGGTDILVKFLRKKFRYIKTGIISLVIDVIIIGVSFIFFKNLTLAFYTVLSLCVTTFALDWVLYGTDSAKLLYIVTDDEHATKICEKILKELDVGATCINGEGAYTGDKKRIVMCAIKKTQYPKLCDFIHEIDPRAFTIVSSAKEIYGEGYKNHKDSDL